MAKPTERVESLTENIKVRLVTIESFVASITKRPPTWAHVGALNNLFEQLVEADIDICAASIEIETNYSVNNHF